MGHSPEDSVTNRDHEAWEVPNLFIVDGSSFVTSGPVNPTSTIGALALRCADRMWETRNASGGAPRRAPAENRELVEEQA
jgi:choline dehydrogenase-like flavoprotein